MQVAWVRVDTQTILTIHNSIITRNQRVSLSHRHHKPTNKITDSFLHKPIKYE